MAVGKCKECGGQVASSAKACPHCGAKVQKKVGPLGWVFALVVVLPIAWIIGSNPERVDQWLSGSAGVTESYSPVPSADEIHAQCSEFASLAKVIMEKRQAETPVVSLIEVAEGEDVRDLILAAYERPAYRTPESQAREISKFENAAYLSCNKASR